MKEKTIASYHDLEVWKRSRIFVKTIYQVTRCFPKEELFLLTSQMRMAVISIPSNIAEGYSRHGIKDYISFLSIAFGSSAELETQILLASDLDYIAQKDVSALVSELKQIQRMIYALRKSLQSRNIKP